MKKTALILPIILCVLISCHDKQVLNKLTTIKQKEKIEVNNIELAKKFYKYLDALQLDSLRVLLAPDAKIYYESGGPVTFSDMEAFIKMFYTSFPDYMHEFEDVIAEDDKVVFRITYSGTFSNPFMDINPNGEKFSYKGIQIFQFENNKVTNFWAVEDELWMMQQLGMELQMKKESEPVE
jgi:predicted ester cyclase